jgi:hypothetical protein
LGSIISLVFGLYSKAGVEPYIRTLFGMSSYDLIFDGIIFIVVAGFLFLMVVSVIIHDLAYPISKPWHFTIETLLMAFLPASVILMMGPLRGYPIDLSLIEEFGVLVLKFGALHILLQFSGFYSNVFPPKLLGGKRS